MKYIHIAALFSALLFLNSCVKDNDSYMYDSPGSFVGLAVFNAIPNSTAVNLLVDRDRLNMTNEKLPFGGYIPHRNVYPGEKTITVENQNSKGESQRVMQNVSLASGNIYSLFLYDENGIKSILTKDNIVSPRNGYAKIRLANMVKDAPALTMWSGNPVQTVYADVPFKTVTEFVEVKAGEPMTFKIIPTNTKANLPEIILKDFSLENKAIYTFMVKGVLEASNENEEVSLTVIKF